MTRKTSAPTPALPAIPATVHSQLGPVRIEWCDELKAFDGDNALGLWCPEERCIRLKRGLHPITAWATLKHEWIHVVVWDAGVGLTSEVEERVADAISAALVAEMLGQ
jgi:hypothetical protein